jgi:hypothetical protein
MGTTVAMMIIGSLGLLKSVISREKVSNAHVIALSMLILLGFVVAFLTAFRTVIATCMLLLLVFAITNYNRARKLIQISALGLGVLVSLAVALALAGKADQVRFWELAMIKHERRLAGASGVWSHRDSEWGYVISHANWLGHGLDFAERQPVLHSWHSPFTLVLGAYGAPAAFFFVAFWLISLIYAFRYARLTEGRDPCNQLPLLCIIFFLVHSLGAIMFKPWAVGPIFGFLIAIGTVVMREAVQQRHEATAPARSYARNPAESGPCRQV